MSPWLKHTELVGSPGKGAPVPDFLTICPSRTGTTWLATHLGQHPEIYIPSEKELRYFDIRWRKAGIESYLKSFQDAGPRLKGEATPSYALLPSIAIRTVQRVNPHLKLIFLARRLPERAWSHTRHCCRHYEGVFRDRTAPLAQLPAANLAADFLSDYALSSADYCATLRRWLAFFPPEQFYIRYFEDAMARPEEFLQDLLRFLGVNDKLPEGDLHAPLNQGSRTPLPDWVSPFLENLFAGRIPAIEKFLKSSFGLKSMWPLPRTTPHAPLRLDDFPGGWHVSLQAGVFEVARLDDGRRVQSLFHQDLEPQMTASGPAHFDGPKISEFEELRLEFVLRQLEEELAPAQVVLAGVLFGFNILRWKKLFFGIRQSVGAVDVTLEAEELRCRYSPDDLIISASRDEVEARIHDIEQHSLGNQPASAGLERDDPLA